MSTAISRISYRKASDGKIKPHIKNELIKIDSHHILVRNYKYSLTNTWTDSTFTSWFDGETVHNGEVHYTTDNVDTMLTLKVQYEGYKYVDNIELSPTFSNEQPE